MAPRSQGSAKARQNCEGPSTAHTFPLLLLSPALSGPLPRDGRGCAPHFHELVFLASDLEPEVFADLFQIRHLECP